MANSKFYPLNHFYPLNSSQLLFIEGPDAVKFLQGQVTCDIKQLSTQQVLPGAQCSPKGRVLVSFHVAQLQAEQLVLRLPANMLAQAQASLGKYIVFSKAKLQPASEQWKLLGLSGDLSAFEPLLGALPAKGHWAKCPAGYLWRLDDKRAELWCDATGELPYSDLLQRAEQIAQQATENDWDLLHIENGWVQISPQTQEQYTPQEINLTLIEGGVSFRKGCYTGQEIVARLHYRGQAKRHTHRFTLNSQQLPVAGDSISNTQGASIGHVVAIAQGEQHIALLACVNDQFAQTAQLAQTAEPLQWQPLPYQTTDSSNPAAPND